MTIIVSSYFTEVLGGEDADMEMLIFLEELEKIV
jgi:hypothetical protein